MNLAKLRFPSAGEKDLTKGGITKTLFTLALPIVIGTLLQLAFNITDTFFVSLMGSEPLAAISVTFPVFFISFAIGSGISIGTIALTSQAIGAGRKKEAGNIALHSIILAFSAGIAVAVIGFASSRLIFTAMGITGNLLELTLTFMNIIFVSFVFQFLAMTATSIIQAGGNAITPAKNLAAGVALNAVLDPLLIFGFGPVPAFGIAGAALATVFSLALVMLLDYAFIFSGKTSVCITRACFKPEAKIVRRIATLGFPSFLSQSFDSVGFFLLIGLVTAFGTSAIAAFGVGIRLEAIAVLPVIGLMVAVMPFVGQNLGAGKLDRAKEGMKKAGYAAALFMLFFASVWFLAPEVLFSPFTSDPAIISIGSGYFRVISLGYVFLGLNFVLGGALQAAGRTDLQLIINMTRWILVIVLAFTLTPILGINGVWTGFPVGNLVGFFIALGFIKSGYWLKRWRIKDENSR
jgi:putative MATE family efflux protein